MAVSCTMYGRFLGSLLKGNIDLETDEFKAMLVGPGYVPNQNTQQFKSAVNDEIVGSGYVAGGQVIHGIDFTYNSKVLTVTASNLAWPVVTFAAARYLVVYNDSFDTQASKPLVCWIDFGSNRASNSQSFYYNWPGGVMFKLAVP